MIAEIMVHTLLVTGILTLTGLVFEVVMFGRGYPRRWGWMGVIALSALTTVALLVVPPTPAPDPVREGEYTAVFPFGTVTVLENPNFESSGLNPGELLLDLAFLPVKVWDRGLDVLATLRSGLAWVLSKNPAGEAGLALLWGMLSLLALTVLILSAHRLRERTDRLPTESVDGREFAVADALGPAVVGFLRPQIVLPRWLLGTPIESLALILAHEEEHLRARDTLLLAGGLGAMVIAPWNPFSWIQLRRLRLAVEMDCDARVVRRGVPPTQYASVLVEVGSRATYLPYGATALTEPPHFLERRMKILLRPYQKISLLRAFIGGAAALFLFWLAGSVPTPTKLVLGATVPPAGIENAATDRAWPDGSESTMPLIPDTVDVGPDGATNQALNSVCLRGPDGQTTCTEVSGDPESHVVCAVEGDGSWECEEVVGARDAVRACMVVPGGMYLCADTVIFDWLEGGSESGNGNQAPSVYSVLEGNGDRSGPADSPDVRGEPSQGTAPQRASANPTFVPVEVYPSVRNVNEVRAALVSEYPASLRSERIGGRVLLHIFVDATGAVADCRIAEGSGYPALDDAALRLCGIYSFVPAENSGTPVPVWIAIPVEFSAR